jgi:hypothetical protein
VLYDLIRALPVAVVVYLLPGWFWARLLRASANCAEQAAFSVALSMALVPAVLLVPTRVFGLGITLAAAAAAPVLVFSAGLLAYLRFGPAKGYDAPIAPLPPSPGTLSLSLLATALALALGVVAGVLPRVQIDPLVTVGVVPDMGTLTATLVLVGFAGIVHVIESRQEPAPPAEPHEQAVEPRGAPFALARRLLLPAVLLLALVRGYAGPALHDWPFVRGVDHYSHAVMAELMMTRGRIEPYLIYPPGFHTMTAEISRLTGLEPLEVFPVLAPALLLLPALALYALSNRLWGWECGVAAALFSVLLGGTYYYYNDAMYPNLVSSQFLMVLALAALVALYASPPSVRGGLLLALLGSSVVLYHPVASMYLAVILALVGLFFVPYLFLRDRRKSVALFLSLGLLGLLSVLYAWDTYDLPRLVGGLFGENETGRGGAAVAMAIGTKPAYDLGHLLATTSQPVAWLGSLGVILAAGELLRRRVGAPQALAYLTLILWALLLFVGSRTSLSGFPDRFERDFGIPLAVFAALALVTMLRSLWPRRRAALLATSSLVVLLAGILVGGQAVRSLEQAAGPSPRLKDRPPPAAVAAAGAWLEEHNDGGNIIATPYLAYVPSRGMLAMGGYTGMQSYDAARIRRGRDLPPFGAGPLWDALWVLKNPAGERTRQILAENDVRYLVFHKRYPGANWRNFERHGELYRVTFENAGVVIFEARES